MRYVPQTEFQDGNHVFIRKGRDQDGVNWVQIRVGRRIAKHQKQSDFRGKGRKAIAALDEAGLNPTLEQFEEIKNFVNSMTGFKRVTRFERPGWCDQKFALLNGTVLSRSTPARSIVAFDVQPNSTNRAGSHAKWIEHVAAPLAGFHLPEFCLMLMFTAPLLRFASIPFNFGFELAGPPATGKTTLAKACASVAGPVGGGDATYVTTMNATVNSLDASMQQYNDMPLILEEANLLTLGAGSAADRKYAELVFRLAEGRSKRRYRSKDKVHARFVWLATSNVGWPQLARHLDADTTRAVADRMITLPIPSIAQGGIYGDELAGEMSLGALSRTVVKASEKHHGTAIRKFIAFLQRELKQRGARSLTDRIESLIAEFCEAANKRFDADARLSRAFGVVYAAGVIAVECGALPDEFKSRRSTMRSLSHHLDARASIKTPLRALADLANGDGVLDLRSDKHKSSDKKIEAATCVIAKSWHRVELMLTPDQLARLEIEVPRILDDPRVKALLRHEDGRRMSYRTLYGLRRQRVYVFSYTELMQQVGS